MHSENIFRKSEVPLERGFPPPRTYTLEVLPARAPTDPLERHRSSVNKPARAQKSHLQKFCRDTKYWKCVIPARAQEDPLERTSEKLSNKELKPKPNQTVTTLPNTS